MVRRAALLVAASFALVALALSGEADAGSCLPKAQPPSEGTGITVSLKDCAFGPTILRAPAGALVTWTNDDWLPHAVAGAGWSANPEPSGTFNPGSSVSHRFGAPGIYAYMCHLHPGMAGIVVVGDAALPAPPPAPIAPQPQAAAVPAATGTVGASVAAILALGAAVLGFAFARWPRRRRVSALAVRAALTDRRDRRAGSATLVELPADD